jgi:hypothetical protein
VSAQSNESARVNIFATASNDFNDCCCISNSVFDIGLSVISAFAW